LYKDLEFKYLYIHNRKGEVAVVTHGSLMNDEQYLHASLSVQSWYGKLILGYALLLAQVLHFGQTRRSGERYVEHSMAVADLVRLMGAGLAAQAAALLHDTIEDSKGWRKIIAILLVLTVGFRVAIIVFVLTKWHDDESGYFAQIKFWSRYFGEIAAIKLADKYTSVNSDYNKPAQKEIAYLNEVLGGFADMASACAGYAGARVHPGYDILWSFIESKARSRLDVLLAEHAP
jgi:(p)ppGpp synthase/HD superfamily hydrolase